MKKIRRSPVATGLLFLLAVVLLFAGTVGGTQAALQVYSSDYLSAFDLDHIGVTLFENGTRVSWRNYGEDAASGFTDEHQNGDLVLNSLGDDQQFQIGKNYDFEITAMNTGTIDQYVRIRVYKYWVDAETPGAKGWFHGDQSTKIKNTDYDTSLIYPNYLGNEYNTTNWIRDDASHTQERDIYYYRGMLTPQNGNTTEPLFTDLAVKAAVSKAVVKTGPDENNRITYTLAYDGLGFVIKAEVEVIQTHNAEKAIRSAWGLTDKNIMTQMGIPVSQG